MSLTQTILLLAHGTADSVDNVPKFIVCPALPGFDSRNPVIAQAWTLVVPLGARLACGAKLQD